MRNWLSTKSGRVVVTVVAIIVVLAAFAIGNRLGGAHGGRYADHQIWEVAGKLTMAKLFCLPPEGGTEATSCKWLLTLEVTEVSELQAGKGILEDPKVGQKYVVDLKDSKVNNYVSGEPTGMVETGSAVTYEFNIVEENARLVIAETPDTSSSLPEIIGAVR